MPVLGGLRSFYTTPLSDRVTSDPTLSKHFRRVPTFWVVDWDRAPCWLARFGPGGGGEGGQSDLEIECIRTGTGYTLFVFGIHTGYTLYEPWDTHVIHANHEKKREILAIPHRIHAMVTCTLSPNDRK